MPGVQLQQRTLSPQNPERTPGCQTQGRSNAAKTKPPQDTMKGEEESLKLYPLALFCVEGGSGRGMHTVWDGTGLT